MSSQAPNKSRSTEDFRYLLYKQQERPLVQSRLQPFFTYFGGKWRAAKHYPIPVKPVLIEPFAGSAGFALHHPHLKVKLFDKDPTVCGLWDYLIKAKETEILALPTQITDIRQLNLPQEAKSLIGFWLNKGMTAPCNVPSKWMRDHATDTSRKNTYWGEGVRNRIASQLQYIRHWTISNQSYADIDNQDATWFIDPPYHVSGSRYRFNKIDFTHLGEWCQSRNGQVIVCEQEGASWLPFMTFRSIKALEGKNGAKQSKEVIWTNA